MNELIEKYAMKMAIGNNGGVKRDVNEETFKGFSL